MSVERQTWLVNKKQYRRIFRKKMALGSVNVGSQIAGLMFLAKALTSSTKPTLALLCCCLSIGMYILAFRFYHAERKMEDVELITPQHAHLLPDEVTLVRSSDDLSSSQSAELLRAAPQGNETPAELLLRSAGKQQDN